MLLVFNTCIPPCCVMFHILFSTHLYSFLLCYVLCYVPCLVFNKCVFPLAVLCTPLCYVPCLVLEINACWHCGICRPVCSHLRTQGCKMDFHGMLCWRVLYKNSCQQIQAWVKIRQQNEPTRFSAYFERKLHDIYRSAKRVVEKNGTHFSFTHVFHTPNYRDI